MDTGRSIDTTNAKDKCATNGIAAALKRGGGACLLFLALLAPAVCAEPARDHIPVIAHIAGITVGHDTIESLTRRFGPGTKYTGQHPHGGRVWNVASLGAQVDADGFYYNRYGRIVDTLSVFSDLHGQPGHRRGRHRSGERMLFMGVISLGMTKAAVLRSLRRKLPPSRTLHDEFWKGTGREELGWHMSGVAERTPSQPPRFTVWDAKLLFEKNRLVGIDVACE